MYVYLFLKMGVWVTNSSIIKLFVSSNLLFSISLVRLIGEIFQMIKFLNQ